MPNIQRIDAGTLQISTTPLSRSNDCDCSLTGTPPESLALKYFEFRLTEPPFSFLADGIVEVHVVVKLIGPLTELISRNDSSYYWAKIKSDSLNMNAAVSFGRIHTSHSSQRISTKIELRCRLNAEQDWMPPGEEGFLWFDDVCPRNNVEPLTGCYLEVKPYPPGLCPDSQAYQW